MHVNCGLTRALTTGAVVDQHRMTKLLAISCLALCLALASQPSIAQNRVSGQGATITANGRAFAKEDRAWVQLQVTAQEKEAATALDRHATNVKTAIDQLTAKGIPSNRIEAGQLAIQPRFEVIRDGNKETRGPLIGYAVIKSIYIFFDDPTQVAAFVAGFPMSGPVRTASAGH